MYILLCILYCKGNLLVKKYNVQIWTEDINIHKSQAQNG